MLEFLQGLGVGLVILGVVLVVRRRRSAQVEPSPKPVHIGRGQMLVQKSMGEEPARPISESERAKLQGQFQERTNRMREEFNDALWRLESALAMAMRGISQESHLTKQQESRDRLLGVMVNVEAIKAYSTKQQVSALAQRFGLVVLDFEDPQDITPEQSTEGEST